MPRSWLSRMPGIPGQQIWEHFHFQAFLQEVIKSSPGIGLRGSSANKFRYRRTEPSKYRWKFQSVQTNPEHESTILPGNPGISLCIRADVFNARGEFCSCEQGGRGKN